MISNNERLAGLDKINFDLIIVGGGIIGSGIANDAAGRGLRVCLLEKDDYGSGTSSRATRLIHGGLRYLEMFDFGLVRQDLRERELLLRNAPHLVKPLPFLVPFYRKSIFYRLKMRVGMILYDILSFDKSLPNHRFWGRNKTILEEPNLKREGLQGSFVYYDGQVPLTERLVMENIIAARQKGARCFNHVEVVETVCRQGKQIVGVDVRDTLTGNINTIRGKLVINVTGAWLDGTEKEFTGKTSHKVRRTKGIHFTAPSVCENALVLFAESDDRLFFVVPWLGYAWVGTTDTDFDDKLETVRANREDVEYLVESVKEVFPNADWDNIFYTNAGVRALVRKETKEGLDESAVSRKHSLIDHEKKGNLQGLVSVVGGKLTAYRGIAEEAVDLVMKKLAKSGKSRTIKEILPGGYIGTIEEFTASTLNEGVPYGLSEEQIYYLINLYGSRVSEIFNIVKVQPALAEPIHSAYPNPLAQIRHAVYNEQCLTLADFMMRRTDLYFTQDQGQQALELIAQEMARLLDWSADELQRQIADYEQEIDLTQAWKNDPSSSKEVAVETVQVLTPTTR
jgi:glycerol-3-phosphate dehydrogenase